MIRCFLILLYFGGLAFSAEPIHPQILRVLSLGEGDPKTGKLSDRMWKVRKEIGNLDIVSDPVSDRYLITKLAGPIDLVHFLALCAQVCSGKFSVEDALYRQWVAEGGPEHEKGLSRVYFSDA